MLCTVVKPACSSVDGALGIVERLFVRRLIGAGEAAVLAEMGADVDVGVDQAGKDGEARRGRR